MSDLSEGKTYIINIFYPVQACVSKIIGVLTRNGGGNVGSIPLVVLITMAAFHSSTLTLFLYHVGLGYPHFIVGILSFGLYIFPHSI